MELETLDRPFIAPISIIDTSALLTFSRDYIRAGKAENEHAEEPWNDINPFDLLDELSTNGRTLVITHRVMKECLRQRDQSSDRTSQSNGIMRKQHPNGHNYLELNTNRQHIERNFRYELADYFDKRQQAGELRSIRNVGQFLSADEVESAKGGIVVLGSGKINTEGIYATYGEKPHHTRYYKNSGDDSIVNLAQAILKH